MRETGASIFTTAAAALFCICLFFDCGGKPDGKIESAAADASSLQEDKTAPEPAATTRLPNDPVELVKALMADRSLLEGLMDWDFIRVFDRAFCADEGVPGPPSSNEELLAELIDAFDTVPEDCTPEFEEAEGYTAVAIPPPMEGDSDELVDLINEAIDGLGRGVEVLVFCTYVIELESCEPDGDIMPPPDCVPESDEDLEYIFAINLLPPASGGWKVRAWTEM